MSSRRYAEAALDLTDGEGVDVSMNSLTGWTLEDEGRRAHELIEDRRTMGRLVLAH